MGETTPIPTLLQLAGVHPTEHPQVAIMSPTGPVLVDTNIADLLRALWRHGLRTRFSCQGGRRPDLGPGGTAGYVDFTTAIAHGRLKTLLGAGLTAALVWDKDHPRRGRTAVRFQPEQIPEIVAALSTPAGPLHTEERQ